MPTYTTQYVTNLMTGEPFTFEIPSEKLTHLERKKELIRSGNAYPGLRSIEDLMRLYEFSLFSSYQEILKIWLENGFTTELITQILTDFGVTQPFIEKLIEDDNFISNTRRFFSGIACDGERASRTIMIVYDVAKSYFSPEGKTGWEWLTIKSPF